MRLMHSRLRPWLAGRCAGALMRLPWGAGDSSWWCPTTTRPPPPWRTSCRTSRCCATRCTTALASTPTPCGTGQKSTVAGPAPVVLPVRRRRSSRGRRLARATLLTRCPRCLVVPRRLCAWLATPGRSMAAPPISNGLAPCRRRQTWLPTGASSTYYVVRSVTPPAHGRH